ncbi:hypothetical protein KKF61_07630 [Patescibacteria group bacterium]|nr:hypothetical protein [Patescibacteria group bacterium]
MPYKYIGASQTEKITNGGFDADTDWTKLLGATIAAGVASVTTASDTFLYEDNIVGGNDGKMYRITFTVSNYSSGNVRFIMGGEVVGTQRSANGTYTQEVLNVGTSTRLSIQGVSSFTGDIDDVSVTQIGCVLQLEQDGITETTWYDNSGNGLDGTVSGALPTNAPTGIYTTDAAGPAILNEAATSTNPTLVPNKAETDTGYGWAAADTPTVVVGGAEVMRWDAVGNVGIGVTPEAWQAAYTVLQIGGTSALMVTTTAQAGAQVELMQNAYYDGAWKYIVADEASDYHQIGGEHIFRYAAAGGAPDAALTWSTALTIENDGNALFGKTIEVDPTPASDHTSSGIIATLTLGETVTFGQSVYQKSDGKLWLTDADAAATMPCVGLMVESTGAADESKQVLFHGFIRDDTWDWTVGGLIYIDVAAGTLTQTAPSGAGDQVQVVGFAYSADIIFFNPNYVLVEI